MPNHARFAVLAFGLGAAAAAGCAAENLGTGSGDPIELDAGGGSTAQGTGSDASGSGDGAGGSHDAGSSSGGGAAGIPCDVDTILAANCRSCHGSTPSGGAPSSLVTYTDLTGPSKTDPSKTTAEIALARIQSTTSPMPPKPAPALSGADVSAFKAWVGAGTPKGAACASGTDAGAPIDSGNYNTPVVCTSGTTWTGGNSAAMRPGEACRSCHVVFGPASDKTFDIGGTVYPTAHEPDDCNGVAGATVVLTGADGTVLNLTVNAQGNFYHEDLFGFAALKAPYTAKVTMNGQERAMNASQTSGDCNSCHTRDGANGAPGRIMAP